MTYAIVPGSRAVPGTFRCRRKRFDLYDILPWILFTALGIALGLSR